MVSKQSISQPSPGGRSHRSAVVMARSQSAAAVVMASCLTMTLLLAPFVDAGAAVPPPDAAAYVHQQRSAAAAAGSTASATSNNASSGGKLTSNPPAFGGSLPGISSQLRVSPSRSRSTLRRRAAAGAARSDVVASDASVSEDSNNVAIPSPPPSEQSIKHEHAHASYYAPHVPVVSSSNGTPLSTSTVHVHQPHDATTTDTTTTTTATSKTTSSSSTTVQPPATSGLSPKAILFMTLLSLQFGLQPLLVRRFTPPSINRSTVVFVQEIIKLAVSANLYLASTTREQQRLDWGEGGRPHLLLRQLAIAGLPAALYCVQNLVSLLAYQNLDPVAFNVLNQTKTLSAALCCYLVLGARQSGQQMAALGMLLGAALVLEKILPISILIPGLGGAVSSAGSSSGGLLAMLSGVVSSLGSGSMARRVTHGVLPILIASFLSGLAGALVQKAVQGSGRQVRRLRESGASSSASTSRPKNFYLFSTELGIASIFLLLLSFAFSADGRRIATNGFFHGWTPSTLVPILTQSAGGICVGLVTKYAGSVRKGFALIFGMLLSGLVQARSRGGTLGIEQMVGLVLASASLFLHTRYPYRPKPRPVAIPVPVAATP